MSLNLTLNLGTLYDDHAIEAIEPVISLWQIAGWIMFCNSEWDSLFV
jgi:hypothetical protein